MDNIDFYWDDIWEEEHCSENEDFELFLQENYSEEY